MTNSLTRISTEQDGAEIYQPKFWLFPALLTLLVLPSLWVSMALFHTLVELFAIGIAVMSFVVAWHSYALSRNQLLIYLGCGYLGVGVIDLAHTLTFDQVTAIPKINPADTIELWISARFLEAGILLSAPFMLHRKSSPVFLLGLFLILSFLATAAVFMGLLPKMFIPGVGLTAAKIYSEYLIMGLLAIAGWLFWKDHKTLDDRTRALITVSIAFTIIAELNFTLYVGFKELPIVLGHLCKLLSFYLIYRLLIESSLIGPITSLSQVLDSYDSIEEETVMIDQNGIIQRTNKVVRKRLGEDLIGGDCHTLLHPGAYSKASCPICQAIASRENLQGYEFEDPATNEWYELSLSGIHFSDSFNALIHTTRPITERKKTEQQVAVLNRLYSVLSHTNQAIVRVKDQEELFQQICDIAVTYGQFKMVWIGVVDDIYVRPEYMAGEETGYLKEMQMRVDDSEWAQGPVGIAAKSKQVACVNNVKTDPDFWPWRDAAIKRGYGALAAVPIFLQGEVIALFTLYSRHSGVFDQAMRSLLNSLSDDISAALHNIRQTSLRAKDEVTIRKLSHAVEQSVNAVVIANVDRVIEYVNPGYTLMSGISADDVIGEDLNVLRKQLAQPDLFDEIWDAVSNGQSWQGEVQNINKSGQRYWTLLSVSAIKNEAGDITHYVSNSADNNELKLAQETINQLAFYDPLTGLANRRLLMDRLEHALAGATRHQELVAILLCDLDNFKTINDSLGHDAGDELLKHISSTLRSNVRADDTVSRLGGDEFVIVLDGIEQVGEIVDIADTILSSLNQPYEVLGNRVTVSASVGVSLFPQDGQLPDTLLRNADLAMYHAKGAGKNGIQFYQEDMNTQAIGRLEMEQKLRQGIERAEFELYYQPQVRLPDKQIIGFEALIRWQHNNQWISPADFIPLAEETGLIQAIDNWVIKRAYQDWQTLLRSGFPEASMAVNISAYQFVHCQQLKQSFQDLLVKNSENRQGQFIIEITEGTLIQDVENAANTLNALKKMGLQISIDDFGTGYSSLNYLKRFPIDQLKVDRSFVNDLLVDKNDQAIVSAIIAIAQKLQVKVIAEGVEQEAQGNFLSENGCHFAQGFHYYRPMRLEDILKLSGTN